jgi:5-methylcytosine-specific restriction endonuclease McrA
MPHKDKNARVEYSRKWREKNRDYQKTWREKNCDYQKTWNAKNCDKLKSCKKEWREKNSEKVKEQFRLWIAANRKKYTESNRKWRLENHEKIIEYNRKWCAENPDKNRHNRRMTNTRRRQRGVIGSHTAADVCDILKLQRNRCAICCEKLGKKYHVDHIIPLAKGGTNDRKNIQITCKPCNLAKGARDPIYHMQILGRLL